MNEPPPRPDESWPGGHGSREAGPGPNRSRQGLGTGAKIGAGAFIGVLYAIGMSLRGDVFPGVVGGVLAGILCFLVLREIEQRRDRR